MINKTGSLLQMFTIMLDNRLPKIMKYKVEEEKLAMSHSEPRMACSAFMVEEAETLSVVEA